MTHLLIVDDDTEVLDIMHQALINAELTADAATGGTDAVEKLKHNRYDLLVTDILMPDIDGLDIIDEAVRQNPDITILAISGGGLDQSGCDLLDAALTSGADAILQKPFDPGELVRTVRALMR